MSIRTATIIYRFPRSGTGKGLIISTPPSFKEIAYFDRNQKSPIGKTNSSTRQ